MNDTEKARIKEAAGENWAVLPFDEKADDERWDKLIAETDELAKKAAAIESDFDENLTESNLPNNPTATESARKSEDDELAEMNPF